MTQGPPSCRTHLPVLLMLAGYAMAGLQLWPSVHVALSNASVFVNYYTDGNGTEHNLTLSLVDMGSNATLLTRDLPSHQAEGKMEFDCSCFLYAGSFRFLLVQRSSNQSSDTQWWSPVLQVSWPTFHISVERASNRSSSSFQIGVSTSEHFHACTLEGAARLLLEVTYLEHNQIGRNNINKVRAQTEHVLTVVPRSTRMELACVFPFSEHDFIRVALRSPHAPEEIKTSVPLYLSRIFPYKLLVDGSSTLRAGCKGAVTVRLVPPPCAFTSGKVLLYRGGGAQLARLPDVSGSSPGAAGSSGPEEASSPSLAHLAYRWLTHGENETEFNCSVFDPGEHKYCFRFVLNYSRSPSAAQTCTVVQRITETWAPWAPWSGCSVTCGEGVRERTRKCLVPSSGGGMQCTGLLKEQSHCSLEDCNVPLPSVTPPHPPAASDSGLRGNLVALVGISLCLVVIAATVLVTVWRKACCRAGAGKCSSVRRRSSSMPMHHHSPGGRKNSDEASICGHSLQRPSFCDSLQSPPPVPLQKLTATMSGPPERAFAGNPLLQQQQQQQQSLPSPISPSQDPERLSPSGQKILPPLFGYRLAQQQLKEMKKQGLREATKVYHVSQSPVDDTLLEATVVMDESTQSALSHTQQDSTTESQDLDSDLSRFRIKSPFLLEGPKSWTPGKTTNNNKASSRTLPDRLGPKSDFLVGSPPTGFSAQKRERTADWVEMVERCGVGVPKNPNFRRTASFHETKLHHQPNSPTDSCSPSGRSFRERSMTQVTPRQIPEGSCRTRAAWEHQQQQQQQPVTWEREAAAPGNPRIPCDATAADSRRRPWIEAPSCFVDLRSPTGTGGTSRTTSPGTVGSTTRATEPAVVLGERGHRGGCPSTSTPGPSQGPNQAEQNRSGRRGPSPIHRTILARKLRKANANASANNNSGNNGTAAANAAYHRQRSATFSSSAEQRKERCRSLPLSGDYSTISSPYRLSEVEKRMIDLPGHVGEERRAGQVQVQVEAPSGAHRHK